MKYLPTHRSLKEHFQNPKLCIKEENDQIELIHKDAIMTAIKPIGKQICLSHHFILPTPKIMKTNQTHISVFNKNTERKQN